MTRFAGLLLAALCCAGCATATGGVGTPAPIRQHDWQSLQARLREAPAELRQALTLAAEARLSPASEAEPRPEAVRDPRVVLLDLLAHADHRALLPDDEFEELQGVVFGEKRLAAGYADLLTAYLVDGDFACRQPAYEGYFRRRYHGQGGAGSCGEAVPFSVFTAYREPEVLWLDPKRVRAIHLLFAGKSGNMASRFGHVALRLVVCPEASATDAECDANLFEHLVLGFQAHVDELSLNTLKALTGDYKAYLFANRFMDAYHDYAIAEFRELYSLPLRLDATQREAMVRELADIHWRYAGEYSFFTRNCATMLQDALRVSWPAFAADPDMRSGFMRPDSLFGALRTGTLADGGKLASLDAAEREGYYFSSTRQFYLKALEVVNAALSRPAFATLEDFLEIDPVARRERRIEDAAFMSRLAGDRHLREAQLMLEEYACLRSERLLGAAAARYLDQQDLVRNADRSVSRLDHEHARVFRDCLITPIREHAGPRRNIGGIPGKAELPEPAARQESVCGSEQARKLLRESIAAIDGADSQQWQRVQEIARYWSESWTNVKMLKQM